MPTFPGQANMIAAPIVGANAPLDRVAFMGGCNLTPRYPAPCTLDPCAPPPVHRAFAKSRKRFARSSAIASRPECNQCGPIVDACQGGGSWGSFSKDSNPHMERNALKTARKGCSLWRACLIKLRSGAQNAHASSLAAIGTQATLQMSLRTYSWMRCGEEAGSAVSRPYLMENGTPILAEAKGDVINLSQIVR